MSLQPICPTIQIQREMGSSSLPSPPAEGHKSTLSRKSTSSSCKLVKPVYRAPKRASSRAATIHHHDHVTHAAGMGARHKRVWKACERCRMKKTKCDGELPCKRCKDGGLVCTAGVRKKMEYKQLPRGYAEVLENTQFALIATVHKLYSMVRNKQSWELGEPELNGRGQPVIHNIAQKLGCIRPNSDKYLPVPSAFPEDEVGMAELARQLGEQQKENKPHHDVKDADSSVCNRTERASSSEVDHSGFEHDYQQVTIGNNNAMTLSPQSYTGSSNNFEFVPPPPEIDPSQSPAIPNFPAWPMTTKSQLSDLAPQFLQQPSVMGSMDMLNQCLVKSEFGTIKPHVCNQHS
ncbi:Fluconazole resistance protein 1 [Fusarium falciforme]